MRSVLKACLTLFLALELGTPGSAQTEADEERIRALAARWERAWNTHDMEALATLFTDDADFVNVGARHWKGRNEIRAQHAARLGQFMDSVWTTTGITVQFLERGIALVHIAWGMRGDKDPDGTPRPPREGLLTWVVVRQGGDWRVRAAQNTNRGNLPTPRDAPPDQSVERTVPSPRDRSDPMDGTWDQDAAIHTTGTDENGVTFDNTLVFRRRQAQ